MRKLIVFMALGLAACGGEEQSGEGDKQPVNPKTTQKIKKAQDVNTELEEIDGELDSLLNLIN